MVPRQVLLGSKTRLRFVLALCGAGTTALPPVSWLAAAARHGVLGGVHQVPVEKHSSTWSWSCCMMLCLSRKQPGSGGSFLKRLPIL